MLYGCIGCNKEDNLGCAGCIGAAYPSHYDPYTGEKIEGLGILPPPAYVTAPPGAFTYYKPQPVIGKGVSFLPKVGFALEDSGFFTDEKSSSSTADVSEEAAAPVAPARKSLLIPALIGITAIALFMKK